MNFSSFLSFVAVGFCSPTVSSFPFPLLFDFIRLRFRCLWWWWCVVRSGSLPSEARPLFLYLAPTSFLRPSVDMDLGRSRGRPRARSQIREEHTPGREREEEKMMRVGQPLDT